ncbi:hypothetical protein [Acidipila rosea]|uniref:Uncharacterized protein n=1 Tax=Acidipila rosea TaxID=768535 RepID=A0A4V2PTY7_9BACT|nr:hypothetical protein [Acidipila rosea]TCK68441.1 hypothetical protein C7378_3518 [Acidipila rosea]
MSKTVAITSEYRNLPLTQLQESPTNPRRRFDEHNLQELADYVPGHIIGIMFRWPLCGGCNEKPHG